MSSARPTYFTSSDAAFYPGTVALINSLRLTGNEGDVVVYDLGLTGPQRQRLSTVAAVKPPGTPRDHWPKALPTSDEASGPVIVIDSDALVVARLDDLIGSAEQGKLVLFPDPDDRWFEEWTEAFELKAPLRRERYANSGFVGFSVAHWPCLLERWAEANGKLPPTPPVRNADDPFADPDQDALNALLMSEVSPGSISMQPASGMAHPYESVHVRIESIQALRCVDRTVRILHHSLTPKVWMPGGWERDFRQAYIRLLPRVLCGDDVALRLSHAELPLWLRPTLAGTVASSVIRTAHAMPTAKRIAKATRSAVRSIRALPKAGLAP